MTQNDDNNMTQNNNDNITGDGSEEIDIIIPSIIKMQSLGFDVYGPISADTIFSEPEVNKYDAKICMFHDQALIPVKTLDFYGTVNFTAGLPIGERGVYP